MLKKLKLSNFRNFGEKELGFGEGITVIVGDNASGKTNILEAIFMLATGKSFKARVEREVIKYGKEIARITGTIRSMQHVARSRLEVIVTEGVNGWPKKKMLINGVSRRLIDFSGNLKVVLFAPQDLDLVTGSPSLRRKFLDTVLSQTDREYKRALLSYEKGLRQRNKLLLRIREENVSRSNLLFWNQLLIKNGDLISKKREEFLQFANTTNNPVSTNKYQLEYDKSAISEGRLEQYAREEVAAATTLVGPHRDDFLFKSLPAGEAGKRSTKSKTSRNLDSFGSRGEQRMGVLWLKMAELAYIEKISGESPLLLLDDIFSELDHEHKEVVMKIIKNHQVILTTADQHFLQDFKNDDIKIVKL